MTLYFSRLELDRSAPTAALIPLLNPENSVRAADAHHRLLWSVFSDGKKRERDFLWRHDGRGKFFTLSARPPSSSDLFSPPEVKVFSPNLKVGDRLNFSLLANATRARRIGTRKSQRVDVVMDLLHEVPSGGKRGEERKKRAQEAAVSWMSQQGKAKGFKPHLVVSQNYTTLELGSLRRHGPTLGILDMVGEIEVLDPQVFIAAIAQGFGRAKAWGFGLMLIRRKR